jgi:hypothetical protein
MVGAGDSDALLDVISVSPTARPVIIQLMPDLSTDVYCIPQALGVFLASVQRTRFCIVIEPHVAD